MVRFEALTRRVVLSGRLELLTGLHIGAGRNQAVHELDNPVMKDLLGRPLIPGSSFKGALRSHLEELIRGVAKSSPWACDPLDAPCPRPPDDFEPGLKERKRDRERHWSKVVRDWELDQQVASSCTVCRLFGSTWFASKLLVPDLSVVPETWDNRFYQYRDGTAIDRETDTAAETRKVEFEMVPPGTAFRFELIVDNPEEPPAGPVDELGVILAGLDAFSTGWATLGGRKAFGLGRVAIHVESLTQLTADQILTGGAPSTITGADLFTLLGAHRARLSQAFSEGTHVSNPA